jgi:sugar lactone lactonase YvrE
MRISDVRPIEVVAAGDQLGEGPAWEQATESLLWVDIVRGWLHRLHPTSGEHIVRRFDRAVSAVAPRAGGGLAVAVDEGIWLLDESGQLEHRVPVEHAWAGNRLGDLGVDPGGRLWFGTLDRDLTVGRGALYRLDPDRSLTQVLDRQSIPNGIGWSPDGALMYFVDSATGRIDVFDYDETSATASDRRPWVSVRQEDGSPDGIAVDTAGGVWVALWSGGQVRRYTAEGELDIVVPLPVRNVTSCCFGSTELDRLYVTTARVEMNERELLAEPDAGSMFMVETGFHGLAVPLYGG